MEHKSGTSNLQYRQRCSFMAFCSRRRCEIAPYSVPSTVYLYPVRDTKKLSVNWEGYGSPGPPPATPIVALGQFSGGTEWAADSRQREKRPCTATADDRNMRQATTKLSAARRSQISVTEPNSLVIAAGLESTPDSVARTARRSLQSRDLVTSFPDWNQWRSCMAWRCSTNRGLGTREPQTTRSEQRQRTK